VTLKDQCRDLNMFRAHNPGYTLGFMASAADVSYAGNILDPKCKKTLTSLKLTVRTMR